MFRFKFTAEVARASSRNAIADALAPFDLRDVAMPATDEALWQIMKGG